MESLLLDLYEAAATLRIRRSLLYVILARGELVGCKIGRRRLISRAELVDYVARLHAQQQPVGQYGPRFSDSDASGGRPRPPGIEGEGRVGAETG